MKTLHKTATEMKEQLLMAADIFSALSTEEIRTLAIESELYALEAGEPLYEAGTAGGELCVIETGSITINRRNSDGKIETVARFVDGESFGELDLLGEAPREETANAESATRVLIFPRRGLSFSEILKSRPEVSARLLRKLMVAVASRLRKANQLIKENSPWVRELQEQVYTDPLTGLHNRTFLEENLQRRFGPSGCALIFLKPDNFKQINDTYGHEAGDAAIREIGEHLLSIREGGEELVRFMGNEYALISPERSLQEATRRAEKLRLETSRISYEKSLGRNDIVISVSAGLVRFPDHGLNPQELIALAHGLALKGRTIGGSRLLLPEE